MLRAWWSLGRKALRRPPRYVAARLLRELRIQAERPWSRLRPAMLSERRLLRLLGAPSIDAAWSALAARPFLVDAAGLGEWGRAYESAFPTGKGAVLEAAEAILRHEFDLLGSGPVQLGPRLPWHEDFKTGRRWPLRYWRSLDVYDLDRPSDVKVPWELSRCQHFPLLGQAYWLSGDERFAQEFVAEVESWIEDNPFAYGVNWACAMDVALRAISWIWGFHFFATSEACRGREFRTRFLRALWLHGEFLAGHLERGDVNGNHYLTDGVGLVFLGVVFGATGRAAGWLGRGQRIVVDEIQAQVTDDGVDFEQSTSYHRLVLEAFATAYLVLRKAGHRVPDAAWRRLERMCDFVAAYTKPDGLAPLIGDADDGRIQKLGLQPIGDHRYLLAVGAVLFERADLKQASGRFWEEAFWLLGPEAGSTYAALPRVDGAPVSRAFPSGGFYVMRAPGTHLIVDCGDLGLRGQGGHGHNDILSFELSLGGMNVVTDCGAYLYSASREWRDRFRSTAFHNAVEVDGQELNRFIAPGEMWRLHYDAVPGEVAWRSSDERDVFRGSHRGYARLAPPVAHVREIVLEKRTPRVIVRDTLEGSGTHRLVWRFHLDPAIRAAVHGSGVRLAGASAEAWLEVLDAPPDLAVRLAPGWVSPRYGVKVPTSVIVLEGAVRLPTACCLAFASTAADARRGGWPASPTVSPA
jgi:uncharacterized heparinase superfamily protein